MHRPNSKRSKIIKTTVADEANSRRYRTFDRDDKYEKHSSLLCTATSEDDKAFNGTDTEALSVNIIIEKEVSV